MERKPLGLGVDVQGRRMIPAAVIALCLAYLCLISKTRKEH